MSLGAGTKNIINGIIQLVYFMRGSVSYTEMMHMTYAERQLIGDFIDKRMEAESKHAHPVY